MVNKLANVSRVKHSNESSGELDKKCDVSDIISGPTITKWYKGQKQVMSMKHGLQE